MKARKRWPWKNVEAVEADPVCVRCNHTESKHVLVNCTDGVAVSAFTYLCPTSTFLSQSAARAHGSRVK